MRELFSFFVSYNLNFMFLKSEPHKQYQTEDHTMVTKWDSSNFFYWRKYSLWTIDTEFDSLFKVLNGIRSARKNI